MRILHRIFEPISGEEGYFCSESEKAVIDAILSDFQNKHLVVTSSPMGEDLDG